MTDGARPAQGDGGDSVPRLIFWETTAGCNLRCTHCRRIDVADQLVPEDLTTEESKDLVDQIVAFCRPILILSGGEPLFRPDILEIARYAVDRGLHVALATNATLIDGPMARRIAESGIARVAVSLDGAVPATHDAFRALPGAFNRALEGIRLLKAQGTSLQINTTVARHNIHELPRIFDLALSLGADALHLFLLVPVGCGTEIADEQMVTPQEYEDTLNWLYDREREGRLELKATCAPHYFRIARQRRAAERREEAPAKPEGEAVASSGGTGHPGGLHAATKGCLAGTGVCFVSHKGEVFPCGYLPVRAGNVREEPLAGIWSGGAVFRQLRDPGLLRGKCGPCEFKNVCGGCRARAFGISGDYLAEEPFCLHEPRRQEASMRPANPTARRGARSEGGSRQTVMEMPARAGRDIDTTDRRLLNALQEDVPLVSRPFLAMGEKLDLAEDEVIARIRRLKGPEGTGVIRQISAIFDSRRLGYRSTLVGARVAPERVDEVAAVVNRHPGVSHNYRRDHEWNLWFTLAVPPEESVEAVVKALDEQVGGLEYRLFPALRIFKIGVKLDMEYGGEGPETAQGPGYEEGVQRHVLDERDRAFVRELQRDFELVPRPFAPMADRLGVGEEAVLAWARDAIEKGWLRRVAGVLRHRQAGFGGNGMAVWNVPEGRLEEVGAIAASFPETSHCLERATYPDWPYGLFTTVHARTRERCEAIVREISHRTGISDYLILFSSKEYKKVRVRYFA